MLTSRMAEYANLLARTQTAGARRVVIPRDDLCEDLAAKTGNVWRLTSAIGAGHPLPADDIRVRGRDAMLVTQA